MLGSMWNALLKRIPPARQEILVIVTAAGLELMVKKLVRLEDDFIIFRGRLAGSSDQHRLMMLPYDHIDNIAFSVLLPDSEVHALFGAGSEPVADAVADAAAVEEPAAEATEQPTANQPPAETPPEPPKPQREPTPRPPAVDAPQSKAAPKLSKSVLLARLRARLNAEPTRGP